MPGRVVWPPSATVTASFPGYGHLLPLPAIGVLVSYGGVQRNCSHISKMNRGLTVVPEELPDVRKGRRQRPHQRPDSFRRSRIFFYLRPKRPTRPTLDHQGSPLTVKLSRDSRDSAVTPLGDKNIVELRHAVEMVDRISSNSSMPTTLL